MANSQFAIKNAAMGQTWPALADVGQSAALMATGANLVDPRWSSTGLVQALDTASLEMRLLTTAIDALRLTLPTQRPLSQSVAGGAVSAPKDPVEAADGLKSPDVLKPAIAMETAMAELSSLVDFTKSERAGTVQANHRMASSPGIAAGGTTAIDLTHLESAAAKAGLENDQGFSQQQTLTNFAADAALAATAFKVPAKEAGEMLIGWRTSMNLDRRQTLDLADATNYLGRRPGDAQAADIGVILQRDGAAATSAGLTPEQAAALTAALLNTGTQKTDAGAALKSISSTLGGGDQASAIQQEAWRELNLDAREVAGGLRANAQGALVSVLAALNAQPAEKRSTLASALFAEGDQAALRLAQSLNDVHRTFSLIADKGQYATSTLGDKGSVRQSALAQSKTQQTSWNIIEARNERLSTATGNALAPVADSVLGPMGSLMDGLSELAEAFPKTTAAVVIAGAALTPLIKAIADELLNRSAKGVLGKAAARLPSALGDLITDDLKTNDRPAKPNSTSNEDERLRTRKRVRVSNRGSRSTSSRNFTGTNASMRSLAGRAPGPVKVAAAVSDVIEGVAVGDPRMVGMGLATAGGAWAGTASGATLGGAIGSVVPVIGTAVGAAVGGLVGGFYGSDYGAGLGDKLGALIDRLSSPERVSQDLSTVSAPAGQPITFAPVINIYGQDQASARQMVDMVIQQLQAQVMPLMMTNPLAVRRGAALTDGVV